jgi:C1A family cysteine protease
MKVIAAAATLATASAQFDLNGNHAVELKWNQWRLQFPKEYASDAHLVEAKVNFIATEARIVAHNAKGLSWTNAHNQFSDMTPEQFKAFVSSPMPKRATLDYATLPVIQNQANQSLDWTTKGAVTPVKNQAQCGGCWAFSSTGATEGALFVASGKLTSLSEEQLIQCENKAHGGSDLGCNGGLMDSAFKWYAAGNGPCTEEAYPYTSGSGTTGTCKGKAHCSAAAKVTGHKDVETEAQLMAAVDIGPVSIAVEADKSVFQSYSRGVIDSKACGKQLDHGILLVGYGTSGKGPKGNTLPYWKIKNSWGATWGEEGYVRFVRDKDQCGIADGPPSYPTGVSASGVTFM